MAAAERARSLHRSHPSVERLRISRELHDVLGHHITALVLQLEAATRVPPERTAEHLRQALSQARSLMTAAREAVQTLRQEEPVDVLPALRTLVQGFQQPRVHLSLDKELDLREPATAHTLFRCVQEILTNALRHSRAENLWVTCARGKGRVEIRARDDGRGASALQPGTGLRGMRERLEELGGGLELSTAPNLGFSVHAWLPQRGRS
jgi:signal transduction histidine kinase